MSNALGNTIEAAEMVEDNVEQLKKLLVGQKKIAEHVGDGSLDHLVLHTEELIKMNTATAEYIRKTAVE